MRHKCSVSRGVKRKCATCMHTHYAKVQGAYGHFCPSPLQDTPFCLSSSLRSSPTGLGSPTGSRKSSYHAQRNLSMVGAMIAENGRFVYSEKSRPGHVYMCAQVGPLTQNIRSMIQVDPVAFVPNGNQGNRVWGTKNNQP